MRPRLVCLATMLAIACLVSAQTPSKDEDWLSYEPAIVELHGKLIIASKYGPPGFGEDPKNDERVKVPILLLSRAINVRGDPASDLNTESVSGVKEVQLTFQLRVPHRQLVGKEIVAKGVLFHAVTGHHYTPVLMDVRELKPVGTP